MIYPTEFQKGQSILTVLQEVTKQKFCVKSAFSFRGSKMSWVLNHTQVSWNAVNPGILELQSKTELHSETPQQSKDSPMLSWFYRGKWPVLTANVNCSLCSGSVLQQVQAGKPVRLLSHYASHIPVHQADVIEIDAVKHKQANVGILESSFLKDN